ncbi:f2245939-f2a3-44d7-be40-26852cd136cc [Thermothielavioides terrestris]|uniref:F2245939-f2a3-44d7-be40-26852cd136cc n=1 Tax=Thermothielavioides terrestris TaxID=2587410 RepID=A0A3S4AVK4_9PEZI|nr:f2245939-f2a3-44d7-be40-26852cd136cc [Thermothielavioides terrestris]
MAPAPDAPAPAQIAPPGALVTQAPSARALELQLRAYANLQARSTTGFPVQSCAVACINSVVTKSTLCSLGDIACECQTENALIIEDGALACVFEACGPAVGVAVLSEASDFCSSVQAGDFSSDTTATTETADPGVVVVTRTSNGQPRTSTYFVLNPTGSSGDSGSGSGSGGSSSGTNGASGSTSSQSSSLSTGAIVGIAVGAAAGAIILCAIAFLIYRCSRRKPAYDAVPPAETAQAAAAAPPNAPGAAPAVYVPGKPELDGKPGLAPQQQPLVTRTASPSPIDQSTVSRHPSIVSAGSPAPQYAVTDPNQPPGAAPPPSQHLYPTQPPLAGIPELQAARSHPQAWQQPSVPEMQAQNQTPAWQAQQHQQQRQQIQQQQQPFPPGYAVPGQGQGPGQGQPRYEMGVLPPELQPNATQFVPELLGQQATVAYGYGPGGHGHGVYEMLAHVPGQAPGQAPR